MKKAGLIGKKLGHSLSPKIHQKFYSLANIEGSYELFETPKTEIGTLLNRIKSEGYIGVNVTIPYKTEVMRYLDKVSAEAAAIGAVNTICFTSGKMQGYNTDYFGLKTLLDANGIVAYGKRIVILGTGGAARCAFRLMQDEGAAEVRTVSRSPEKADQEMEAVGYDALRSYETIDILINTTPVGMSPNYNGCPVNADIVHKSGSIVDIIYNPPQTQLLKQAKAYGKICANGLMMLSAQGIKAQEIWNGEAYSAEMYQDVYNYLLRLISPKKTNVVLIGMPGSGKTSIGQRLAKKLGKEFVDTDAMIEAKFGPIPDIFSKQGEAVFREYEREAAELAASLSDTVISTGGGIILNPHNMQRLGQTGVIVFLDRPLEKLIKDTDISYRPLLAGGKDALTSLYNSRHALYKKYADIIPDNTRDIDDSVTDIISKLEER
ncbi:MAG: shikimate dehydrogenase [Christensenellales bacterium]|jgi:shikimate dehydrogenase